MLLLVGAATLINSWTMSLAITDRIQRLRRGTVVIGEGNLDHRIDIKGNDEFTELAASFNTMTAKLSVAENRYQTLFNTLMEGFCIIEVLFDSDSRPVDYRFLECNPAFEGQTGLLNAQGRLMRELAPDHEAHWFEIYGKVALTGEPASFENEARALKRWYDVSAYRVGEPEDRQVAIVFNDITDRKRAEEALHHLNAELELRVEEQTAEIRRANESLEQRIMERTAALQAANETLRGSRVAALNLMEDALQARQQTEKASDELQEINKELESFIYSVSHDLRAPIRAMSGFAKILHEDYAGKLDAQGQDYLDRILKGSEKSTQLINDLLNLSKISRQELDRIQIDLSKTASKVADELREMDPGRHVEVVIQKGMTASVDPRLIELVLSNLLGNAWKFTAKTEEAKIEFGALDCGKTNASPPLPLPFKGREKGGDGSSRNAERGMSNEKFEIRKEPVPTCSGESEIVYYVRDNGAGFDMKYADRMFWPFHRLHSEKEFEGTGIGLTIVERIIRRHGGKVWAESEVGKGAVFFFTLG
jgi:PAS domain S-box-containing protein